MADEAREIREFGLERVLLATTVAARDVIHLPSGRAGVLDQDTGVSSGQYANFATTGVYTLIKTSGFVALPGNRAYWDHSANAVNYKKVNDRDFYVGRFVKDASSGETTCSVDLNIDPPYDLDLMRDPYVTVPVGTQALGGFLPPAQLGGALQFLLSATNEAQKLDALSVDGFAEEANAIVEFAFRVPSDGAGTVVDVSLGIANDTHATDADSITESVFIHLNANSTTIYAESDDGTTEVVATDTTLTYTEGSAVAQRVEVWFDMRDPADVQIYVNGVLVLGSTVFDVDAGTGPWKLLVHIEKTSSTDAYTLVLDWMRAHYAEQ